LQPVIQYETVAAFWSSNPINSTAVILSDVRNYQATIFLLRSFSVTPQPCSDISKP
jgi:hypothetical protein